MRYEQIHAAAFCIVLSALAALAQGQQTEQRVFDSPDAAVDAFITACAANDTPSLIAIFGPLAAAEFDRIDDAEERANRAEIVEMAKQLKRIESRSDTERIVLFGRELWPFPMPMVLTKSGWQFNTEAGLEELLKRRVGRNELLAIDVCRAFVEAQLEYAQSDHDQDSVAEFAQRILSTSGNEDGLYWETNSGSGEASSPLGPFLAAADASVKSGKSDGYMGYRFKVLTGQGKHAPGGKTSYIKNRNMTDGFALVAWPVDYGHSGVMTFVVSHHGAVFEKDLGRKTDGVAKRMSLFNPDSSWKLVTEGL